MKKLNIHPLKLTLMLPVIMAVILMTACHQWDEVALETENGENKTFHINLVVSATGDFSTRATEMPDTSYFEHGSDPENAINYESGDFKILLFDGDGNLYQEFEGIKWKAEPTQNGLRFSFTGGEFEANPKDMPDSLQLMFLANWGTAGFGAGATQSHRSYPTSEILNDATKVDLNKNDEEKICYLTTKSGVFRFAYVGGNGDGAEIETWYRDESTTGYYIPMFGLSEKCPVTGNSITFEVGLLRSFAKIEVIDNRRKPEFPISNVKLTATRYWMRLTPDIINNPTARGLAPTVSKISVTNDASFRGVKFKAVGNKFVAYVPEIDVLPWSHNNINTGDILINLYADDDCTTPLEKMPSIRLGNYTDQILRNHVYRFVINEPSPDPGVSYWVYPWTTAASSDITFD